MRYSKVSGFRIVYLIKLFFPGEIVHIFVNFIYMLHTVQITFIFIDFRVCDFAFKTQNPAFRVLNVFYFQTDFNLRIIAHMAMPPYIAHYR